MELQFVELRVQAARPKQIVVPATFDDPPFIDHEDHIGALNCGQPMGDHNSGLAFDQPVQSIENQFFRRRIQPRARLIQNQDRRIANNGPGDGDPLALASGERHAPLADNRVVPFRHLLDELVGIGQLGSAQNL